MQQPLPIAKSSRERGLLPRLGNRHGLITGAAVSEMGPLALAIDQQGGDRFFGEPALNIADLMQTDEAHLLFNDAPPALLEKVGQVVRLIRSKSVGVYFVPRNPLAISDAVLGSILGGGGRR
jgi:hypothetical protein